MSEQRKIVVTIDQLGNAKVDAQNFNGVSCENATRPIEQALSGGATVDVRSHKDEFYNQGEEVQQTQSW